MRIVPHRPCVLSLLCASLALVGSVFADSAEPADTHNGLLDEIGRAETRVWAEPFVPAVGGTVDGYRLADRLARQSYRRVHELPAEPGTYFWGHDVFWIYRRAHRLDGDDVSPLLFALDLAGRGSSTPGLITGFRIAGEESDQDEERPDSDEEGDQDEHPLDRLFASWATPDGPPHLEPELLAETLEGDRARRLPLRLADLPEHVWRPVLAAEDARFFDHLGLDGKSLARALLANVRAGKAVQGGSTITQQLIKNRELTPKRTIGRKASEALRALWLEADYTKEEILEAYLATVYLGHVDGLAIHGFATASRVYFGRDVEDLDLAQAATLAAIIQGPNRLDPERHPQRVQDRRDWVLGRMLELGWATEAQVERARAQSVRVRRRSPAPTLAPHFIQWLRDEALDEAGRRIERGRGVVVESDLDPLLQEVAENAVREHLERLRQGHRSLRGVPLQAALVTLDARSGAVLAYVGGGRDGARAGFDRARNAHRQPGSAIKPLLLLEAFDTCRGTPLHAATRVDDAPLRLDLPSGPWSPVNSDGRFYGVVTIRESLRRSLNVPFVRLVEHCGREDTARRLRRAGIDLPDPVPPSFALGAIETTPLDLARAYSALLDGRAVAPRPWRRIERPGGRRIEGRSSDHRTVASAESAFLVRHLLVDVASQGTARTADIDGVEVAAKTGTTSERRDAWLAGIAQGVVTVVWVGRDDDQPLGLTGSTAAAPLWHDVMEHAVHLRPPHRVERPDGIVVRWVDPETGLRVGKGHRRATPELFREDVEPRRKRWWRKDPPEPVIR